MQPAIVLETQEPRGMYDLGVPVYHWLSSYWLVHQTNEPGSRFPPGCDPCLENGLQLFMGTAAAQTFNLTPCKCLVILRLFVC
jgi:hypothetical protein